MHFTSIAYRLLIGCLYILSFAACNRNNNNSTDAALHIKPYVVKGLDTLKTSSGLKYMLVLKKTAGASPAVGKEVKVHYTGYFTDGKIFDSSVRRGEALSFALGTGRVIKGWDEGIALMHVGEKARFIIPYELAYGIEGSEPIIPPLSTLIFDIELLDAAQ